MLDDKFRKATLRFHIWYSEYIDRRMLRMDLPGRRPTRGTKKKIYGCIEKGYDVN